MQYKGNEDEGAGQNTSLFVFSLPLTDNIATLSKWLA